jgi:uncharacterized protein YjbI with pentapeptide repeats
MEKKHRKHISSLSELPSDFFDDNPSIDAIDFEGITFDALRFHRIHLRSCSFTRCTFNGCIFDDVDFQRIDFLACRFSHCTFGRDFRYITGSLRDCALDNCDFSASLIQNTKWPGTTLRGVDFLGIKAKSIDFSNSFFDGVDFDGANLVRGVFQNVAGLERRVFYGARLDDCIFDWQEAFIVMEFGNARTDDLYKYGIEPALQAAGVDPKRVDRYEFHGRITDEILENIITCRFVVAECSASNKNVFFEIGFALGHKKPVVFCVDEADHIPFDLKDYKFIIHHDSIDALRTQLTERVRFILGHGTGMT